MKPIRNFLALEERIVGWRFWLLWVLATNAGFFPGLRIGNLLAARLDAGSGELLIEILRAVIIGTSFASLIGLFQGLVIARHGVSGWGWFISTALGWAIGTFISTWVALQIDPKLDMNGTTWIIVAGFSIGAIVGLPQFLVLKRSLPNVGWWWVAVSSIAWGVFFPGAVSGLVLARMLPSNNKEI